MGWGKRRGDVILVGVLILRHDKGEDMFDSYVRVFRYGIPLLFLVGG